MEKTYSIGELAVLSGVSVRTLRFYEEAGLLCPKRDSQNGYRIYGSVDVDRLQEILLLRRLGIPVRDVASLLSTSEDERRAALTQHLKALREERDQLNALITTVEHTLNAMRGEAMITDGEKFDGLKRELIENNEKRYGLEMRNRFGEDAVDKSNRKMLNMSEKDYAAWQELDTKIRDALAAAVRDGADPAGPEGERICSLHRCWLCYTWPFYTADAHKVLTESYVADKRFMAYYDRVVPGCTAWLRDAVAAHAE